MLTEPPDTAIVGRSLQHLDVCSSTNDVARAAAIAGAPDGYAVLADAQAAGRGQRGRAWLAAPAACVLLSVVLRPPLSPADAPLLTMLAASAGAAAVEGATGLHPSVKWPNDLILSGRKVGGILLEADIVGDHLEYVVVGVGLNVNLDVSAHPEIADLATSLAGELGHPTDRLEVARELLRQLDRRYALLRAGRCPEVFAEWRSRLGTIGRRATLIDGRGESEAVFVEDVAPDGALIARRADGSRRIVHFGEVSLR